MQVHNTVPLYDGGTHRTASTHTDTLDPTNDRIVRVWDVEPIPLEEARATRKDAATSKRYAVETGGIPVGGALVRTDRESQAMIAGARTLARTEPDEPVDFKAASGWVTMDSDTVVAIATAVGQHVRECFRRERALHEAIDAAETVADVLAVDIDAGWLA